MADKTYNELREMGFTPSQALEIINSGHGEKDFYSRTLTEISDFIGMPDIALNDYDYLEDELFL